MIVAGPSHASRLRFAYETGEVAPPVSPIEWFERPGESITSPFFRESKVFNEPTEALLFVTDFRLGNRRLVQPALKRSYSGIDSSLISKDNDKILYDQTLGALDCLVEKNPRVKLLFWSLAGREFYNRSQGKYADSGVYCHPVWNLSEVEERYTGNVLSMLPVIKRSSASLLFRDNFVHPSWVGNELITRIIDSLDQPSLVFDSILKTCSLPSMSFSRKTYIIGHSVWISRLRSMVESGLIEIHNAEVSSARSVVEQADEGSNEFDVFIVSSARGDSADQGGRLGRHLKIAERISRLRRGEVKIAFWEASASKAKSSYPGSSLVAKGTTGGEEFAHPITIGRRHVDFRTLAPTLDGVKDILLSLGADVSWRRFGSWRS